MTKFPALNKDVVVVGVVCDGPSLPMLEVMLRSAANKPVSNVLLDKEQATKLVYHLQRLITEL